MTAIVRAGVAPFRSRPKIERHFWERLLRRSFREAGAVDLENLIASKGPSAISVSEISVLVAEHNRKLGWELLSPLLS